MQSGAKALGERLDASMTSAGGSFSGMGAAVVAGVERSARSASSLASLRPAAPAGMSPDSPRPLPPLSPSHTPTPIPFTFLAKTNLS